MSWINSRFPGKCKVCGKAHTRGTQVWWVKGERGVACSLECVAKAKGGEAPKEQTPQRKRRTEIPESPMPKQREPEPIPADDLSYKDDGSPDIKIGTCEKTKWEKTGKDTYECHQDFGTFIKNVTGVAEGSSPVGNRSSQNDSSYMGKDWDLNAKFKGAQKLLVKGWPEGRAFADKIGARLGDIKGKVVRFKVQRDVAGFAPDVGAYCAGQPDCMWHYETHEIDGRSPSVLKVVVNCCTSAGVEAKAMAVKVLAVIALVEALETAGKSVEIVLCAGSECYGPRMDNFVTIKEADEWMDSDRVAFLIGHPATFRRLFFAVWENSDMEYVRMHKADERGAGYGVPDDIMDPKQRGDIYIGRSHLLDTDWRDLNKVRDWIFTELKNQGVELE